MLVVWIDGELVRHVEGMCLIFRNCFEESLANLLHLFSLTSWKSDRACRTVLLPIVNEAAISEIYNVEYIFVDNCNKYCRTTGSAGLRKGIVQNV